MYYLIYIIIILYLIKYLYCKHQERQLKIALNEQYKYKNYKKAKDIYKSKKYYLHLARLAHENNKGQEALYYYNKCLEKNNFLVLIDIGDIYHFGLKDIDIDLDIANYYYQSFLNIKVPKDNKYRQYVRERLEQLQLYNNYNLANTNNIDVDTLLYIENNDNNYLNQLDNYFAPVNDIQSVHDTTVNKTISSSVSKLKDSTEIDYPINSIIRTLNEEMQTYPIEKQQRITRVIDRILSDNNKSYSSGMTSSEVLELVGNRIINKKINNGFDNLLNSLDDCVEHDNVVCFTGIHNKIIDSLNMIDEDVVIVDRATLNQEMLNTASQVRNNLSKKMNEDHPKFDETLQNNIKKELESVYVDTKILKLDELNDMIKPWIEYV